MLETNIIENTDTIELKLFGEVEIKNGDTKIKGKNHWVGQGFGTLAVFIGSTSGASVYATTNNWYILLGMNTVTPTNVTMTTLVKPISAQPNAKYVYGFYYSGSTNAVLVRYEAQWYTGTVSGTIGELGLYLTFSGGGVGMASRLSAADNSFTAFTVDTSSVLDVLWNINLVYA